MTVPGRVRVTDGRARSVEASADGRDGRRMIASASPATSYGCDFLGSWGLGDIAAEYSSSESRQARYVHGPGADEHLLLRRGGAVYAYHTDALGSVTRITDASGATARSYRYDAFGQTTSESGSLANPYMFTGRRNETTTGLYCYRARWYDPARGRFLSQDPLGMGDGPNRYAYAGNNPVNRIDSSGRYVMGVYRRECGAEFLSGPENSGEHAGKADPGAAGPPARWPP